MASMFWCWICVIQVVYLWQLCSGVDTFARSKRAACDQITCHPGSRCVADTTNSAGYKCACYPGYVPPTCSDRDECSLVHTLCHNGSCVNTPGSFKCNCNDGYSGPRCNSDVNECQSNPCLNNNTCVNTQGSYHCRCYAGFIPPDCRDRDECRIAQNVCNRGTCINTPGSFRCSCFRGYTGSRCKIVDPCAASPCHNGGTCVTSQDGSRYTCKCYAGFNSSSNCDDINECSLSSRICLNNGSCVNTPGSFRCACASGYTGRHCQTQIDYCQSSPCLNGGTCVSKLNGHTCDCFEGLNNTADCIDIDECKLDSRACHNGTCINTLGSFHCVCNHGYQGQRCTDDTDECKSNPCFHGTCTNSPGSFSCICKDGYTGRNCSVPSTSTSTVSTTVTPSPSPSSTKSPTSPSSGSRGHTQSAYSGGGSSDTKTSWVSGHYWVIIVVVLAVLGAGIGAAILGFRRLTINSYKQLGNKKSPSSPSTQTSVDSNNSFNNGFSSTSIENPLYIDSKTGDVSSSTMDTNDTLIQDSSGVTNDLYGEPSDINDISIQADNTVSHEAINNPIYGESEA